MLCVLCARDDKASYQQWLDTPFRAKQWPDLQGILTGEVQSGMFEVSIDSSEYEHCLIAKEWSPLAQGQIEHKYCCLNPSGGPGLVYIDELKGKTLKVSYLPTAVGDDRPGGWPDPLPGENAAFPPSAGDGGLSGNPPSP